MTRTGGAHRDVLLRRSLPALAAAVGVCALLYSFFTVDATEYGLVTRFGRVVRVISEPGLYITVPFDRVARFDKRLLFSRPAPSEYLTIDKKNIVIESLATWRIAEPERFLATLPTQAAAEQALADVIIGQIGSVIGQSPASALVSGDPAENRYRSIVSAIERGVAAFARPAYGIEVVSVDIRRLSLPELNRTHVFDRMTAERAKIAKQNRSAGELQARKITAQADHERVHIAAEAASTATQTKAEGDAEASRTYADAFRRDPKLYEFLRTLQAYDKILDDKTTLFFPADAEALQLLHFDAQPASGEPAPNVSAPVGAADSPRASGSLSADADRLPKKKSEGEFR
jgi:modulator of FtsH protease HflC